MNAKRLLHTLRLWMIPSGTKRAAYLRQHGVFAAMGTKCVFMDRKIPLYPNLIRVGDNVQLASNITFVTHDVTHKVLAAVAPFDPVEKLGCISIGNNVFVGAGTTIMYDVNIGSNVIIGAGSVVTKDIPDNTVAVGVPARPIMSMEQYMQKRMRQECYDPAIRPYKQEVGPALEQWCWEQFEAKRK